MSRKSSGKVAGADFRGLLVGHQIPSVSRWGTCLMLGRTISVWLLPTSGSKLGRLQLSPSKPKQNGWRGRKRNGEREEEAMAWGQGEKEKEEEQGVC